MGKAFVGHGGGGGQLEAAQSLGLATPVLLGPAVKGAGGWGVMNGLHRSRPYLVVCPS